jgi:hypothetical protein
MEGSLSSPAIAAKVANADEKGMQLVEVYKECAQQNVCAAVPGAGGPGVLLVAQGAKA